MRSPLTCVLTSTINARPLEKRAGKISVRDHTGLTYLTTRDSISTRAVALLSLEALPVGAASGLGVATAFWVGNPAPGESASP